MVTSQDCLNKYGKPENQNNMVIWSVPSTIHIKTVPQKIYCNKDMLVPLSKAFFNLIEQGIQDELKTWDGCFNIRKKRGLTSMSLHSWGIAIDVNAAWNGLNMKPTLSPKFVKCFTDAGFEWGGNWQRLDGMHFQLKTI
jgi:hypothetical protein